MKTGDEIDERGLSGPRWPHQCHHLAGEDSEANPVQQADRTDVTEPAPPPQASLAKRLGLPERPEFAEDLGDSELRDKVGELAAKVVALTAEREGTRSPLDAILNAEAAMAMPARRESAGPSLADRVRRLRQEARDHAAE